MSKLRYFGSVPAYLDNIESSGKLIVLEGTDGVGRSTQIQFLREWLEVRGHAVVETGFTRSRLVGETIDRAKSGHSLSPLTFTLLYACDFADRLEKEVLPALRAGYIVLADRYLYTVWARAGVRGVDQGWLRELFSFAPYPDLVIYLRVDVNTLARRVLLSSGIDHWEAGKDQSPELDIYESFLKYQSAILTEFERLSEEFGFQVVDARRPIETVQESIRAAVGTLFPAPVMIH
jgi:dTMP kinase